VVFPCKADVLKAETLAEPEHLLLGFPASAVPPGAVACAADSSRLQNYGTCRVFPI